jgi:hypothetical protein
MSRALRRISNQEAAAARATSFFETGAREVFSIG